MADYPAQEKEIELDLEDIPKDLHKEVKEAVGQFIIDSIIDTVGSGTSPVSGERSFKKLTKKYADKEKGGDTTPNLYLLGDMLGSLDFKITKDGVKIGVDESQWGKADGHNNFSGESQLPKRRFIPDEGQTFKSDIMNGVDDIIEQYRADAQSDLEAELEATGEGISTDLFSNESIADILLRRLRE